jgi:hypothetical protein
LKNRCNCRAAPILRQPKRVGYTLQAVRPQPLSGRSSRSGNTGAGKPTPSKAEELLKTGTSKKFATVGIRELPLYPKIFMIMWQLNELSQIGGARLFRRSQVSSHDDLS